MFDYNETTNVIARDGVVIGLMDGAVVVVRVQLTTAQKKKLKEYLVNSGYVVEGVQYRKVDEGNDGDDGKGKVDEVPVPVMDPLKGDKTPEVVEWYRDHEPEEFLRRYKGRRTHLGVV